MDDPCRTHFFPEGNTPCCPLCHGGEEDHALIGVKDCKGEVIAEVCCPVADRLRAMGYAFEEPEKNEP